MDVIQMPEKVPFIPDNVIPKPPLPKRRIPIHAAHFFEPMGEPQFDGVYDIRHRVF